MAAGSGGTNASRGVLYGFLAYAIWGLFPLYWPLLKPASATEILADRIFWTFVLMAIVATLARMWPNVRVAVTTPRTMLLMTVAAVTISCNWGLYIWAVNTDHVVDASLGYFINPLVSVAFGVIFLRERLRPLTWAAIGVGCVAIVVLTIDHGSIPWIGLGLAFSFGTYALVRKLAGLDAIVGLAVESMVTAPVALAYLIFLGVQGQLVFLHHSVAQSIFSVGGGPVTALPLLLFGAAVTRVPLSTIGLLQYVTPTLQFILGVRLFHETMTTGRWVGFAIVWVALALVTYDNFRKGREPVPSAVGDLD